MLLEIDDSPERPRYKQNHTEPSQESRVKVQAFKMGKENQGQRMFPRLNNSKEELKKILRRLEEPEPGQL